MCGPLFTLLTQDSSTLSLLTSHLTATAGSGTYRIPPPSHLALLITMLVHPSTTGTPVHRQAFHLLSRILDLGEPKTSNIDLIWTFTTRKRKRRSEGSDDEEDSHELEKDSLFTKAGSIWDVIEWSFYKGEGGWIDLLSLIVRILREDFYKFTMGIFLWIL